MRTKLAKDLVDARDGGNDDEVARAETALEDFVKGKIRGSEGLHPRKEGYRKVNLAIQANQDKFKSSITFKKPDPSKMRKLKPKAQREEEKTRQTEDQKKADEQERRRQLDEEVYGSGSAQAQGLIKKFMGENMRYHYVQKEGKASRQGFRFFAPGSRPEDQRQRYGWKVNDQLEPLYEAPNDEDMQDILQPQNQYKTPQQVDQFYRANRMQRARYIDIKGTEGDQGLRGPYEPRRAGEDEDAARILATFNPNAMRQGSKSRFIQTMFPDRPTAARRGVRARRATARGRGMDIEYNDSHEMDLRPIHGMGNEESIAKAEEEAKGDFDSEAKVIVPEGTSLSDLSDEQRAMLRRFNELRIFFQRGFDGANQNLAAIKSYCDTADGFGIDTETRVINRYLTFLLGQQDNHGYDELAQWQVNLMEMTDADKDIRLETPGGGLFPGEDDENAQPGIRTVKIDHIIADARETMERSKRTTDRLKLLLKQKEAAVAKK
jgi:hypothetical protein